jgi:hypothetical protein
VIIVTIENDRAAAIATVLADDGFRLGVLFKGDRAPAPKRNESITTMHDVERKFAIGA